MQYRHGHCEVCDKDGKIERETANHILHLVITIVLGLFTAGIGSIIWIVVWILSSIRIAGWRCSTCGSAKVNIKLFENFR